MKQLGGIDPLMYVRALGLLARNPSIVVVPLLMGIVGVFVAEVFSGGGGGGVLGSLTAGIASLIVVLLQLFGFGTACIIADGAWRRGRSSFDDGWNEARRKGGDILSASFGFTFVLYVALYAGSLVGPLAYVLLAAAVFFLIYTIPAAAIGGVPGGAALQVSIERARANPVPTLLVAIVAVAADFALGRLTGPIFADLLAGVSFASAGLLASVVNAIVQAVAISYTALIVTKTYTDISFGRRF